jgi:hypothetical protein
MRAERLVRRSAELRADSHLGPKQPADDPAVGERGVAVGSAQPRASTSVSASGVTAFMVKRFYRNANGNRGSERDVLPADANPDSRRSSQVTDWCATPWGGSGPGNCCGKGCVDAPRRMKRA